jgi:hypothetical protein
MMMIEWAAVCVAFFFSKNFTLYSTTTRRILLIFFSYNINKQSRLGKRYHISSAYTATGRTMAMAADALLVLLWNGRFVLAGHDGAAATTTTRHEVVVVVLACYFRLAVVLFP